MQIKPQGDTVTQSQKGLSSPKTNNNKQTKDKGRKIPTGKRVESYECSRTVAEYVNDYRDFEKQLILCLNLEITTSQEPKISLLCVDPTEWVQMCTKEHVQNGIIRNSRNLRTMQMDTNRRMDTFVTCS